MGIKYFYVLIFLTSFLCKGQASTSNLNQRPNILFIAFDDLKPVLGCYGDSLVESPNIDKVAARGMVFKNAHCQQAVCGPSRASILTGLLPDQTQVWDLKTKMRDVNPDILTIPQYFKQNGYHTVGMGKIFDGRCVDGYTTQDAISWSVPFRWPNINLYANSNYSNSRVDVDERHLNLRPSIEKVKVNDSIYRDTQMVTSAIKELKNLSKKEKPFFLAVGFAKPHLPFTAPEKYWDLYDRDNFQLPDYRTLAKNAPFFALHRSGELRDAYTDIPLKGAIPDDKQLELIHAYYATVSYVDYQLGRLLEELENLELNDNTIIVLWGDHGFHLGDHGIFCKHTNYEQATRSPLIITSPFKPEKGSSTSPVELLDVFPTLCDMAGLSIPDHLSGKSLNPIIENRKDSIKHVARSQYTRSFKGDPVMGYSYRSDRYRYTDGFKKIIITMREEERL